MKTFFKANKKEKKHNKITRTNIKMKSRNQMKNLKKLEMLLWQLPKIKYHWSNTITKNKRSYGNIEMTKI